MAFKLTGRLSPAQVRDLISLARQPGATSQDAAGWLCLGHSGDVGEGSAEQVRVVFPGLNSGSAGNGRSGPRSNKLPKGRGEDGSAHEEGTAEPR